MDNKEQTKRCIEYIKKSYLNNISSLSMEDIVSIALKFGEDDAQKHAAEYYQRKLEREKKEAEIAALRVDYTEEIDDSGKTWYIRTHFCQQREDSRKIKVGDVIQYKAYLPGYEGEENGIMIISSFDFKSDFAARAYYSFSIHERINKETKEKEGPAFHYCAGIAPNIYAFSLATDQEIKNFFKEIKERKPDEFKFYFEDKHGFMPDVIKEKYEKFLNEI